MYIFSIANCDHILFSNGWCLNCIVTDEVKHAAPLALFGYWAPCLVMHWGEENISAT